MSEGDTTRSYKICPFLLCNTNPSQSLVCCSIGKLFHRILWLPSPLWFFCVYLISFKTTSTLPLQMFLMWKRWQLTTRPAYMFFFFCSWQEACVKTQLEGEEQGDFVHFPVGEPVLCQKPRKKKALKTRTARWWRRRGAVRSRRRPARLVRAVAGKVLAGSPGSARSCGLWGAGAAVPPLRSRHAAPSGAWGAGWRPVEKTRSH